MAQTRKIVRAKSDSLLPGAVVNELLQHFAQLDGPPAGILFFRAASYDDLQLEEAIRENLSCPVVSCTTAGEVFDEYGTGGAVAIAFSSAHFAFRHFEMADISVYDFQKLPELAKQVLETPVLPGAGRFGILLVDGLSASEESLAAKIYSAFRGIPLVGGSAGDDLEFRSTRVFCQGKYRENSATFTLIETHLPFETLHLQHFEPTDQDLVITGSDPARRIVHEIDAIPAAQRLAEIMGLRVEELTPQDFARYPLMLQIGDDWYVRSVQKANPDGSLTFYCAIDDGLPLTVARGVGLVETLTKEVELVERSFSQIYTTFGVDCVLRRLEIAEKRLESSIHPLLKRLRFCGFNGYGEQINSLHVNQTLTAVVLGEKW